jgi:hypothetical protein
MAKKRNTKKKYGGQSAFEMGMASYVRHLLDYTDGGGNWIVDLNGFTLPDGTQPSARWITNRIIHNYQKGSEGSDFFGKRFEYSSKAVSFLASILNQMKRHFNEDNVNREEVEEGIYDRESFNKYVNDAIKIIDSKTEEILPKVSRVSSNKFDSLPVETLARPIKPQSVKVSMTPAVLTSMVNDKTRELQEKSQSDNITINSLKSKLAEFTRQNDMLTRKLKDTEEINKNMDNELIKLRPTIVKPEVIKPKVLTEVVTKPEVVTEAVKPEVLKPEVATKPEDITPKVATEVVKPKVVTDTVKQNPEISEEDKAKARKRAEIIANLEIAKKQQEINNALAKLPGKPKIKTRDQIISELSNPPPKFTPEEIQKLGKKLNLIKDDIVDITSVNIFLNISRKSVDPENAHFIEYLFIKNIINNNSEMRIKLLLNCLYINEETGTIELLKTINKYVSSLWLTSLWNVDPELVDKYKTTSFLEKINLFKTIFDDLKKFKNNTTDENDTNLHNTINVYLEESIGNMIKNRIVLNWSIFGALFVLDNKNMYNTFVRNLEFYSKNTKLGQKGINNILQMISIINQDKYNLFFKQFENVINEIETIIDSTNKYFLDKTTSIPPNIDNLREIYSQFTDNSSVFLVFLLFYSYKEKKVWPKMENLYKKFEKMVIEWPKKMNETEILEYTNYLSLSESFCYSIKKMLEYSYIPDEIKVIIGFPISPPGGGYIIPPPPGGGGYIEPELPPPPGGGYTQPTSKNKKKGGRRQTQKKKYRK